MSRFSEVQVIREFTNDNRTCGVYSVNFNGKQEIIIRNGASIGLISHFVDRPASDCVNEIRDDVKLELLESIT